MKTTVFICSFIIILSSCKEDSNPIKPEPVNPFAQKEIDWPSLQKAPWPMYRHDPQLTGRSPYSGPVKGIVVDTIILNGFLPASLVLDAYNNLYIPASNVSGDIHSFNLSTHQMQWDLKLPTNTYKIPTTPTITLNNSLVYSSTRLYSIAANGSLLWQKPQQKHAASGLNVQIDKVGKIYYIEGTENDVTLFCVNPGGDIFWSYANNNMSYGYCAPAFSPDGSTLYIQCYKEASIIAYDVVLKKQKWSFGSLPLTSTPLVDNSGNIYFQKNTYSTELDTFFSLFPSGDIRWKYIFHKNDDKYFQYFYQPTIDHDGNIYLLAPKDTLVSLNNDGTIRWKFPLSQYGGSNSSLVCDANNVIYMVTRNNDILAITHTGNLKWKIHLNHIFDSYPSIMISGGYLFIIASYSGKIFVVN